jgi:putative oxidoreductase
MKRIAQLYESTLNKLTDLPPLILRLVLAYGFFTPAKYKVTDFSGTASWFDSLGIPMPVISAYAAGITEMAGVILLTLGFKTRYISLPMIFTMLVAIFTVHIDNGFSAAKNGYEIAFYYIIMLFTLMVIGSGRISLDYLLSRNKNKS